MDKPAIHLKYIKNRVTSFFNILGKANQRPYCADEVIGWSRAANYSLIFIYQKKTLSNNGWAMDQLPLPQKKFPVEDVKIDIKVK